MADLVTVSGELEGLEQFQTILRKLPDAMEDRLLNNACAAGARVIAREWKRTRPTPKLVPAVRSGAAAAKHARIGLNTVSGLAIVAFQQPHSRLAHLFEFGTSQRVQTTTGRSTGRMPARPFMRPAVDSVEGEVEAKMAERLAAGIEREIGKMI